MECGEDRRFGIFSNAHCGKMPKRRSSPHSIGKRRSHDVISDPGRETTLAKSDTPLMQQYREVKSRYPGMLVLFRVGDFFELFGADAETAAHVLDMALTSRGRGAIPMAGF